MAAIDLSKLPAPDLVEPLDFETILAELKADLLARGLAVDIDLTPVLALESEPLVLQLEAFAYRELALRANFNQRARAALLPYAKGADLDNVIANLGVQREANETDDALLARGLLAPDSWSVAGPTGAYKFHARSVDPSIVDVAVSSPAPAEVRVALLTTAAGGIASPDLLATVQAALSDDTVRPLTDQVTVVSAATQDYVVTAELIIGSGPDAANVMAEATAALQTYAAAQQKLNLKIARNAIVAALMQPGVEDLVLTSPVQDIPATAELAPHLAALNLTIALDATPGQAPAWSIPVRLVQAGAGNSFQLASALAANQVLDLTLNGVAQWEGLDYAVAGTTVTFTGAGFQAGAVITLRVLTVEPVAISAPVRIVAAAPGLTFNLASVLGADETLDLDINGVRQWAGLDYTVSGITVTFTGAGYAAGDVLTYRRFTSSGA